MAHGYHSLQHWNHWLHQDALGNKLLDIEQAFLKKSLERHFGKHIVLLGVPQQRFLFKSSTLSAQTLISPLAHRDDMPGEIEANFSHVPILTGSVDLVFLPHTLEFVENPRKLFAEACRIVKPEGLIAVLGFNPVSMWGLRNLISRKKTGPWAANFIAKQTIVKWLDNAGYQMELQKGIMFRPPVGQSAIYDKLRFMERVGGAICPFLSGVYVLIARAKVMPLTPIRTQWKQRLGGFRITPSVTSTIARRSK